MVFTIRPPVRWPRLLSPIGALTKSVMFFLAATAGALVVTLSATGLGDWVDLRAPEASSVLLVAVAGLLVSADQRIGGVRLPSRHHQVSRETILRHLWVGAIPYGFALGTGFWTWVNVGLPYFLVTILVLSGDRGMALSGAVGFAAGRTMPLVGTSGIRDLDSGRFGEWVERTIWRSAPGISSLMIVGTLIRLITAISFGAP